MNRFCFVLAIALGVFLSPLRTAARPAQVFQASLDRIRRQLPPNYEMRLPAAILLGGPGLDPDEIDRLIVRVIPTASPPRMTVSLFTCATGPYPCLVGSFAVESDRSVNAQRQLRQHQAMAAPITLATGVRGYFSDGTKQQPPSEFSSLMWQQDGMIYTVSFLATERQNILLMGHSMATEPPIRSTHVAVAAQR